jgi:hypothetical protein
MAIEENATSRNWNPVQMALSDDGVLGRRVRAPYFYRPQLELRDIRLVDPAGERAKAEPCLVWQFSRRRPPIRRSARLTTEALDEFVGLLNAGPQAVLRFAQKRGVLGLCAHGRPFTHTNGAIFEDRSGELKLDQPCLPRVLPGTGLLADGGYCETIADWKTWIADADAVLRRAAKLKGAPPLSLVPAGRRRAEREARAADWNFVISHAQTWLAESGTRWTMHDFPQEEWLQPNIARRLIENPRRLQLVAHTPMLFDVLAFQLAQVVTQSEGPLICAACNLPFTRVRKPRPGGRSFCSTCGHKGAMRILMRERRKRER